MSLLIGLLIAAAVIVGLIIIGAGWLIGVYNMIVMALQTIRNQWSNCKTEYQRNGIWSDTCIHKTIMGITNNRSITRIIQPNNANNRLK